MDFNDATALIDHLTLPFAFHQIIEPQGGEPEDLLFLQVNRAFLAMAQLEGDHLIGKRYSEVCKNLDTSCSILEDLYKKILAKKHETPLYLKSANRWYTILSSKRENGFLSLLFQDSTEEREQKILLKKSKTIYQSLINKTPDLIYSIDRYRRFTAVNKSLCLALGLQKEEIIGKTIEDLPLLEAEKKEWLAFYEKAYHAKEKIEEETTITMANGDLRFYEATLSPILDSNQILGIKGTNRDITKQKKNQETLKGERARLANVIEGTNAGTWEWDLLQGEITINKIWEEILGYSLDDLCPFTYNKWLDLVCPKEMPQLESQLQRVFSKELKLLDIEHQIKHRDGSWVWVQNRGKVISWDEEERAKAEEDLKRQHHLLKEVTNQVPGWIYQWVLSDSFPVDEGKLLFSNENLEAILGVTMEEAKKEPKKIFERIKKEDLHGVIESMKEAMNNFEDWDHDFRITTQENDTKWLRGTAKPKKLHDGQVCWHGYTYDNTRRQQAEEKIKIYSKELELRNQELENIYSYLDKEIDKAMRLHKRTFPKDLPHNKDLFLAAYYQPAQKMGGDYYNVIELEKKVILYLSDVTGHGLEGAYLSLFVRDTLNSYLHFTPEERITVSDAMEFLARQYRKERWPEDYFVCIYIGILEKKSMDFSYLGAGFQTSPLLCKRENTLLELNNSGLPISTAIPYSAFNFQQKKIQLKPTWTLLFNTDGLTEHVVKNMSYEERAKKIFLRNSYRPPKEIVEIIREDFKDFNYGSLQGDDDITLLVMQINDCY